MRASCFYLHIFIASTRKDLDRKEMGLSIQFHEVTVMQYYTLALCKSLLQRPDRSYDSFLLHADTVVFAFIVDYTK